MTPLFYNMKMIWAKRHSYFKMFFVHHFKNGFSFAAIMADQVFFTVSVN